VTLQPLHGPTRLRALAAVQLAAGLCTALAIAAVLVYADRGYDITDEGFYLNWLSRPGLYATSTTQFGYVYHPLYVLTGGDVALLRRVGVALTVTLASATTYLAVRPISRSWPKLITFAGTITLAGLSVKVFDRWLLTPNYNLLVMHGVLVVAMGLLLVWRVGESEGGRTWPGYALLGVGGALLFLAKPPGAALTGVLVVVILVVGGAFRWRPVLVATATALGPLALVFLAIDGSLSAAVQRMRGGTEELQAFDPGHSWSSVLHVDNLDPTPVRVCLGLGALTAVAALTWLLTDRPGRRLRLLLLLGGGAAAALTSLVIAYRPSAANSLHPSAILMPLALPAAALLCRIAWDVRSRRPARLNRREIALTAGLLLMPVVATVGTTASVWRAANHYVVLWAVAAVVLLRPLVEVKGWQLLTPTLVATCALAILPTVIAMDQPYRQPGPVWRDHATVVVGDDARIKVADDTAAMLAGMRSLARGAGLAPGDTVIDLTGEAPGLVFAIGAVARNSAWVPGAYPGSDGLLRTSVDALSCRELARVWLFDQPGGVRSVADAFYPAVGATPADFETVGSVPVPSLGIANAAPQPPIRLLRDRRDPANAVAACEQAREAR